MNDLKIFNYEDEETRITHKGVSQMYTPCDDQNTDDLKTFNYESKKVRTIYKDREIWWVLKDVCDVLDIKNTTQIASRLESDEVSMFDIGLNNGARVNIINESGLYNVIIRSDKPEAKKFRYWVTHEVLPSIRKHGVYATDEFLANPDLLIEILQELKAERATKAALKEVVQVQNQQITEMKPKASYYDVVLNCKDAVAITTIAKDYGKSGKWLNDILRELGIQFKQGKIWLLYQKYAEKGYTLTKTHTHPGNDGDMHSTIHTYWTQKGRLFIYDLLKDNGILPRIEQEIAA